MRTDASTLLSNRVRELGSEQQDDAGNVWYFGEDSKEFQDGSVSTEGSWQAGVNGAEPGILMEAHPQRGDKYYQEFSAGKPTYYLDGQTVAWNEYLGRLQATVDWCERKLAGEEPIEIRSLGIT